MRIRSTEDQLCRVNGKFMSTTKYPQYQQVFLSTPGSLSEFGYKKYLSLCKLLCLQKSLFLFEVRKLVRLHTMYCVCLSNSAEVQGRGRIQGGGRNPTHQFSATGTKCFLRFSLVNVNVAPSSGVSDPSFDELSATSLCAQISPGPSITCVSKLQLTSRCKKNGLFCTVPLLYGPVRAGCVTLHVWHKVKSRYWIQKVCAGGQPVAQPL